MGGVCNLEHGDNQPAQSSLVSALFLKRLRKAKRCRIKLHKVTLHVDGSTFQ